MKESLGNGYSKVRVRRVLFILLVAFCGSLLPPKVFSNLGGIRQTTRELSCGFFKDADIGARRN